MQSSISVSGVSCCSVCLSVIALTGRPKMSRLTRENAAPCVCVCACSPSVSLVVNAWVRSPPIHGRPQYTMSSFVVTLKWCNKAVQWQGRPGGCCSDRDIECVCMCVRARVCGVETRALKRGYCHETDCKCHFPLQQPEPLCTTHTHTYTNTQIHTDTHALAYFNRMLLTGRDVRALRECRPRLFNPLLTLTQGWGSRIRRHTHTPFFLFCNIFFGSSDWLIHRSLI